MSPPWGHLSRWHSRAGCCCWQSWDQAAGRAGGQEGQEAPPGRAAAHPGRRGSSRGRTAARPWPWAHRDPLPEPAVGPGAEPWQRPRAARQGQMALGRAGKGVRAGCVWHPDALLVPTIPRFLIGAVWLPVFHHLPPRQGTSSLLLAAGLAACPHQCSLGTTYCCCSCQHRGGCATSRHPVCAHTRSSAPGASSIPEHLLVPRERSTCAGGPGATRDWAGKWLGTALPQLRLRSHQVDKKQWLYF